jgi:hypothetical protein
LNRQKTISGSLPNTSNSTLTQPLCAEQKIEVQPLPYKVPLRQIYSDLFRYLYRHTKASFEDREINGSDIWKKLEDSIPFVFAHPNGWAAHEQAFLRDAAVHGGLVPENAARERVFFVSEGEASVHFVMAHGSIESRRMAASRAGSR